MPVFLHGFFDFCLLSGSIVLILVFLVFIGVLYFLTYKNLKIYSASDRAMYDDNIEVAEAEQKGIVTERHDGGDEGS